MAQPEVIDLKSRLQAAAAAWCSVHGNAPLSRLGKRIAFDATFFDRIASGGGVNLATLEKFAAFFADPLNWVVEGESCAEAQKLIPQEALAFCHAVGVTAPAPDLSAGTSGEITPADQGAAA
ncbi:hypothetical protein ACRAQ6_14085 [Erythrobacter sp. HA6-11]